MVRNNPCSGCEDREILCHSNCEKYLEFRKQLEEKKELERQAKTEDGIIIGYYKQAKKKFINKR